MPRDAQYERLAVDENKNLINLYIIHNIRDSRWFNSGKIDTDNKRCNPQFPYQDSTNSELPCFKTSAIANQGGTIPSRSLACTEWCNFNVIGSECWGAEEDGTNYSQNNVA
jgi:hypothetical protein